MNSMDDSDNNKYLEVLCIVICNVLKPYKDSSYENLAKKLTNPL